MDFLTFWLPIIGGVLLGGFAGNAWYGGDRIVALWVGFLGLICFLLLGVLQIQRVILTASPIKTASADEPKRGPTLEATRNSKIDASGAQIPGDLPFQFGRADDNSLINMPGIVVTRTDTGFTVTSGQVTRQFPPPTGEFTNIPLPELRRRLQMSATELRGFQEEFDKEYFGPDHKWPEKEKAHVVGAKYAALYEQKLAKDALSLASAALAVIGTINSDELSREASAGGTIVYHGKFVGPHPARKAADFLEVLLTKLPST